MHIDFRGKASGVTSNWRTAKKMEGNISMDFR
jgi:hypothetical protein